MCEITNFDYGDYWAAIEGEDELAVITCGSTTGSICEAIKRLSEEGVDNIKLISICLLLPVQQKKFASTLAGVKKVLIAENHSAQFNQYLRGHYESCLMMWRHFIVPVH